MKRNIFTFKKDDIAPYVIGVQFRWQFDPNSDTYQETYQIDPESINVIHIIDRDGKVIDPFTEAWMTSLEELDDDLFYIGENEHPIHESEYGKCEFDIVKVFNLAQTLSSVHSEPICIYDRTGQDKME